MKNRLFILLIITSMLTGCTFDDLFNSDNITTRKVTVNNAYGNIEITAMFDITLIQDTATFALITCSDNSQSKVNIYIKDSTLYLDNSIAMRWLYGYDIVKVELHLPSIPPINVRKPIKIQTLDTFTTDMFYLIDWGCYSECNVNVNTNLVCVHTSDDSFDNIVIKGHSINSALYIRGSSYFDASLLYVDNCELHYKSINDLFINVSQAFVVSILSSGDVHYWGNPTVILEQKGSGKLIQEN